METKHLYGRIVPSASRKEAILPQHERIGMADWCNPSLAGWLIHSFIHLYTLSRCPVGPSTVQGSGGQREVSSNFQLLRLPDLVQESRLRLREGAVHSPGRKTSRVAERAFLKNSALRADLPGPGLGLGVLRGGGMQRQSVIPH